MAQPRAPGTTRAGMPAYRPVNLDRETLAAKAYDRFRKKYPSRFRNASAYQLARVLADLKDHISALQGSLATGSPALFNEYACRARVFFSSRHLPPGYIPEALRVLREVIAGDIPEDLRDNAAVILTSGVAAAKNAPSVPPPCIDESDPLGGTALAFLETLAGADRRAARSIIDEARSSGISVQDLCLHVFQPVLRETGRRWLVQQLSVAEEHYITAAVASEIERLHEESMQHRTPPQRGKTVVLASVERDPHGIGIMMVAVFFDLDGWNTYPTGPDTPALSLVHAVRDRNADVVAISCTIPSHIPTVHYLIRALRADPGTRTAKIIVGGYPFSVVPDLWQQLGADAYAPDAAEAVAAAHRLVGI